MIIAPRPTLVANIYPLMRQDIADKTIEFESGNVPLSDDEVKALDEILQAMSDQVVENDGKIDPAGTDKMTQVYSQYNLSVDRAKELLKQIYPLREKAEKMAMEEACRSGQVRPTLVAHIYPLMRRDIADKTIEFESGNVPLSDDEVKALDEILQAMSDQVVENDGKIDPAGTDKMTQVYSQYNLSVDRAKELLKQIYPLREKAEKMLMEQSCPVAKKEAETQVAVWMEGAGGGNASLPTERSVPNYQGIAASGRIGLNITRYDDDKPQWQLRPSLNFESFSNPVRYYGALNFSIFQLGLGGIHGWDTKNPPSTVEYESTATTITTTTTNYRDHIAYSGLLTRVGLVPTFQWGDKTAKKLTLPLTWNGAVADKGVFTNLSTLEFSPRFDIGLNKNFYLFFGPNAIYQHQRGNVALGGSLGIGYIFDVLKSPKAQGAAPLTKPGIEGSIQGLDE